MKNNAVTYHKTARFNSLAMSSPFTPERLVDRIYER